MNAAAAIVLGLLIGWLVEWIIDWFYWRGRMRATATANMHLREKVAALEGELDRRSLSVDIAAITDKKGNDNLQAIKGIGPVFAKRLNEAGVYTFEQVARLTSREMEEILGTLFKRFYSRENTILAQAREFAERMAKFRSREA
jgi:predicted flap endonuclease-1-like 5' DNA nuclease